MADEKAVPPAPVTQPEPVVEDTELEDLERQITAPDAAIEALRENDPIKANELEVARLKDVNTKLIARQRQAGLVTYREQLVTKEFPLAPIEAVTGTTKSEMRKNAEKFHNANVALIKSLGLTLPQPGAPAPATPAAPAAPAVPAVTTNPAGWGPPPPIASESVAEAPPQMDWNEFKEKAYKGELSRAEVRQVLAARGPRISMRENLGNLLSKRFGEQKKPEGAS